MEFHSYKAHSQKWLIYQIQYFYRIYPISVTVPCRNILYVTVFKNNTIVTWFVKFTVTFYPVTCTVTVNVTFLVTEIYRYTYRYRYYHYRMLKNIQRFLRSLRDFVSWPPPIEICRHRSEKNGKDRHMADLDRHRPAQDSPRLVLLN